MNSSRQPRESRPFSFREKARRSYSEHKEKVKAQYQRSHSSNSWRQRSLAKGNSDGSDSIRSLQSQERYAEFLSKVNCPFCWEDQKDKTDLVKHLKDSCCGNKRGKASSRSVFVILFDNTIKCKVCISSRCVSIDDYLVHFFSEGHQTNMSEVGEELISTFLYCNCCKMRVPNNSTQLELHLSNKIHHVRRKSEWNPQNLVIYGFGSTQKQFKCPKCPNDKWHSSFIQLRSHLLLHFAYDQGSFLKMSFYCCFCDQKQLMSECNSHIVSKKHVENTCNITSIGAYEICLFCGFFCNSPRELSIHMTTDCLKIEGFRKNDNREEANAEETKWLRTQMKEHNISKSKCILVKAEFDVVDLLKILRKIGEINYVGKYDEKNFMVEFKKNSSLEMLLLLHNFLEIDGKKLDIKFLSQQETEEIKID